MTLHRSRATSFGMSWSRAKPAYICKQSILALLHLPLNARLSVLHEQQCSFQRLPGFSSQQFTNKPP